MILSWYPKSVRDADLDTVWQLLEDAKSNNVRLIPLPSTINLDGNRAIIVWSGCPNASNEDLLAELEFLLDEKGYDAERGQKNV